MTSLAWRPVTDALAIAPRVGVGVLVVESGRVLLTHRRRPPEAGAWSIVGGRLEPYEALEHAAVREAYEEAGIHVGIDRLLCVTDHILPDEREHWVSPAYLGRVVSGMVVNAEPEKAHETRWFALHELPARLTVTARRAIDAYLASLDGGDA